MFAACHLPDRSRRDYHYVMDNLFLWVNTGLGSFCQWLNTRALLQRTVINITTASCLPVSLQLCDQHSGVASGRGLYDCILSWCCLQEQGSWSTLDEALLWYDWQKVRLMTTSAFMKPLDDYCRVPCRCTCVATQEQCASSVHRMLPRSFHYPSVKQSLQDRTDIWCNITI